MNSINPRISIERRYLYPQCRVTLVTFLRHATHFVDRVKVAVLIEILPFRRDWSPAHVNNLAVVFFFVFFFSLFLFCIVWNFRCCDWCWRKRAVEEISFSPSFDICLCAQFQLSTSQLMMNDGLALSSGW